MSYKTLPVNFKYVVGPDGNYPATVAGFQAGINDATAAGQPLFLQAPGIDDMGGGTQATVPDGAVIVGSVSEMPVTAVTNQEGTIVFASDVSLATTTLDAALILPNSGKVTFQNIAWISDNTQIFFPVPDGSNTLSVYLNNCRVDGRNGTNMVDSGNHVSGDSVLNIYLNNTYLNPVFCRFINLSNNGSGTVSVSIYASNNSVVSYGQAGQSEMFNPNVSFKLNLSSGSSYWDGLIADGTLTGCSVVYEFSDCTVGLKFNIALLAADGSFSNITLTQQNVQYIGDSTSSNVTIFSQVGGVTLTYPGSGSNSNKISLQNCNWSDIGAVTNALNASISDSTDGAGNFINAGNASFNNLSTAPSASSTTITSNFQLEYSANLTFGTAIQNIQSADIVITGTVLITAATGATVKMGTASSSSPASDSFTPSITTAALTAVPFTAYVPSGWYFVLDKSGTITATNTYIVFPV